jgi:chromosome segregation ATPase
MEYEKNLDKLKAKMEELNQQWTTIDTINKRVVNLESQLGMADNRLEVLKTEQQGVLAYQSKLADLRALVEDTCHKEEELYSYRSEIDEIDKRTQSFMNSARELDEKIAELSEHEQNVMAIAQQIDDVNLMSDSLTAKIKQTEEKARIIAEVEHKIENLGTMVGEIDGRIAQQVERNAMIDKTEKRLDQLNYLLGDINMKIQSLTREQQSVDELSEQLKLISSQSLEAKGMMERLAEEKLELVQEEQHILDMRKQLELLMETTNGSLKDFRSTISSWDDTRSVSEKKLEDLVVDIAAKMGHIEEHRQGIVVAEANLQRVSQAHAQLKEEMDQIVRRSSKLEAIDGRLVAVDTIISDIEIRVESIDKDRELIASTQKKIDGLTAIIQKADAQIEHINSRAGDIEKVGHQVEDIEKMMQSLDKQARHLSKERDVIADLEKRLSSLNLLSEDIKIQLSNLAGEKQWVQEAVEKTSELRFLLGEVESKLNLYRMEKEKIDSK